MKKFSVPLTHYIFLTLVDFVTGSDVFYNGDVVY